MQRPSILLALTLAAMVAISGACTGGGDSPGDSPRAGAPASYDLSGASLIVGSKASTEQLLLGHITRLSLEHAGADVIDRIGPEGSEIVRPALEAGDIDMYWEYTGTAWRTHLGQSESIPDSQEQHAAVAESDLEQNGIRWLAPAPFENTYALAVRRDTAEELGVATISDFARLVGERPDEATLCVGAQFAAGDEGLPGLQRHYGVEVPDQNVDVVGDAVVYSRVGREDPCRFGSVLSTDGRIAALDLTVLEDDMNFFPRFNPALSVREEVVEANPDLEPLAAELAAALDRETMTGLNARVDVGGEPPEFVAESWLREQGIIG